jgi:hypothetical protein
MKIKITLRFFSVRRATIKKTIRKTNKCWGRCGETGIFILCWWECKKVQSVHYGSQYGDSSKWFDEHFHHLP